MQHTCSFCSAGVGGQSVTIEELEMSSDGRMILDHVKPGDAIERCFCRFCEHLLFFRRRKGSAWEELRLPRRWMPELTRGETVFIVVIADIILTAAVLGFFG